MGMVSLNEDPTSALIRINDESGGHLHVVRQQGDYGVPLRSRMLLKCQILDTEVFPHRNRASEKRSESTLADKRGGKPLSLTRHPVSDVFTRVEQDA